MSLGQLHTACDEQFRTLCEVSDSPSELQAELLEEASRYGLWAGNVGAGHPGQWSLDYRLREASLYRNEVSRILQILRSQLQKIYDLIKGVQLSIQDLDEEGGNDHPEKNEDSGSESSWGLSDTESVGDQRISTENEGNSNGNDEIEKLLQSIRLAISILYRLPLRRPAPTDRLQFGAMSETHWFEGPDVAHVKDKFPKSQLPENVKLRLGKAITKRRQLMSYRRSHHEKLKSAHGWWDDASSQAMTKATTLHSDQVVPLQEVYELAPSVADSARTSLAASQSTREISIEVPPRPLDKDGQCATTFQCNYCQLTIHVTTDSSWRRHVLRDLQPYVCTFSECNLEDGHLFETENDWFEHEAHEHRFKYFCSTPGHQKHTTAAEFQAHLKSDHSMNTETLEVALSVCKYPDNLSAGICDFCLAPSKNLKRHVSRHLRQLALFAISREDFAIDDDDAAEKQDNLPRKADISIREDESTDTNSKTYETTSKSASEREDKNPLAPENDAQQEIGSEDSFPADESPENHIDEIEDHKSFSTFGPDLAQPRIDESNGIGPDPRLSPLNLFPPASQSMMGQFSSEVSSNTHKKHNCKVCNKGFTRLTSLQTHMYSHTGERPFACDVEGCDRQFSVVSNLRRHQKVHTGDVWSEAASEDHNSDQNMPKQGLLSKSEMGPPLESSQVKPDNLDMGGLLSSETGLSKKRKNPEFPSDTTLQSGFDRNLGKQQQLPSILKTHTITDALIASAKSNEMGVDEDKEDEKSYLRHVRFEPLTAGDTERFAETERAAEVAPSTESPRPYTSSSSSENKRRPSGVYVNGQRVLDLNRKDRSLAETSMAYGVGADQGGHVRVVQSRPKPQCWEHGCNGRHFSTFSNLLRHQRELSDQAVEATSPIPPKQFSTETDRSAQAYSDLNKAHLALKEEYSKLQEQHRIWNTRLNEIKNDIEVLSDDKDQLVAEKLRLKEEDIKLEEGMLPEDIENIKTRARENASVPVQELGKRT